MRINLREYIKKKNLFNLWFETRNGKNRIQLELLIYIYVDSGPLTSFSRFVSLIKSQSATSCLKYPDICQNDTIQPWNTQERILRHEREGDANYEASSSNDWHVSFVSFPSNPVKILRLYPVNQERRKWHRLTLLDSRLQLLLQSPPLINSIGPPSIHL